MQLVFVVAAQVFLSATIQRKRRATQSVCLPRAVPGSSAPPNCAPAQVAKLTAALPQQPAVTPFASPKVLNVLALVALAPRQPGLQPHVVPGATDDEPSEETRRNRATFDFIPCNKLQTKAGLRVAFASGQPISFPIESMEVKANWVPVGKSKSGRVSYKDGLR
ncbi:hypothetical protein [Bradyrhizobium sp. CCBAU 11357]|uniref:hypothetical protein n=1 Tax=Bradyrhizobium sp. CCBAU 11357 TaxID=1630808 RepID=UPI00230465D7|nr:hypothetical protein [Bradyrhizobium sp. CCBAU 11357]